MSANYDLKTITVGSVGAKPAAQKQPDDVFDYVFDYTQYLSASGGVTVLSATASVTAATGSGGTPPVLGTPTVANNKVTLRVSGGSDTWVGTVSVLATLSDGEKKEAEIQMLVVEV